MEENNAKTDWLMVDAGAVDAGGDAIRDRSKHALRWNGCWVCEIRRDWESTVKSRVWRG